MLNTLVFPQNRERIYIIAFLDHSIDFKFPTPPNILIKLEIS